MTLHRILVAAAIGVCVSAPAYAQQVERLSLQAAEARAIQNHPAIQLAELSASGAGEAVREAKSAYYPTVVGSVTGADAQAGTRIAAGGLNNPLILDRLATGVTATQMLTDFGRTSHLAASTTLALHASEQNVTAQRAEVLLQVDRTYFDSLRSRAVQQVATQTVTARQQVVDQVSALTSAGLKSTLDLNFAKINLSEAQLLLVQANNDVRAADARLSDALGERQASTFELAEEPMPQPPPPDSTALIAQALQNRPDVARERLTQQSETAFADAERALSLPTLSFVGAAGLTPYHQTGLTDQYSAIAFNMSVPLTNGHLLSARHAQAQFRASAAEQNVRDIENRVALDVQVAWLDTQTAFQRLALTNQLLSQATDTLDLAQQRYTLGLSSIVELTQAQLNLTGAQIEQTEARYDYQAQDSVLRFQIGSLK